MCWRWRSGGSWSQAFWIDGYNCTQYCPVQPPGVVPAAYAGDYELASGFLRGFHCSCWELGLCAMEAWGTGSQCSVTCASTTYWILWVRGHCTEKNRKEIKWIPGLQKSIASYQSALWCVIHAYKCSVFLSLFKYGRETTTCNLTNACQKFYVQCVCVCSANGHSCCVSSL